METPGSRAAAIRQALRLTQGQMAFRMTERARSLGLDAFYETPIVSRIETGVRALSLDDGVVLAEMDPEGRGTLWIATGRTVAGAAPRTTGELAAKGVRQPGPPPTTTKAAPGKAANDKRKGR